jgi:hypothetical protein
MSLGRKHNFSTLAESLRSFLFALAGVFKPDPRKASFASKGLDDAVLAKLPNFFVQAVLNSSRASTWLVSIVMFQNAIESAAPVAPITENIS